MHLERVSVAAQALGRERLHINGKAAEVIADTDLDRILREQADAMTPSLVVIDSLQTSLMLEISMLLPVV